MGLKDSARQTLSFDDDLDSLQPSQVESRFVIQQFQRQDGDRVAFHIARASLARWAAAISSSKTAAPEHGRRNVILEKEQIELAASLVQLKRLAKDCLDATEQLALRNSPFMKRGGKRRHGLRAKFIVKDGDALGKEEAFHFSD